jgi:hypothetical protein
MSVFENGAGRGVLQQTGPDGVAPPADLQARHLWSGAFPGWESPGAADVTAPPYNARGDGIADDTAAIQRAIDENTVVILPKGYFRVTRPIRLKAGTRLVGISRNLSNLVAAGSDTFSDADDPQPVLVTPDSAAAAPWVAFLTVHAPIDLPGAYAVEWRAGRNSLFRDVNVHSRSEYGYNGRPGKPNPGNRGIALVRIAGNGGGRWYDLYQETAYNQTADYRHILVQGTSEPLRFYQVNPEHAQSDANFEIRSARNVDIYGLKSEGNFAVLWIRDSDRINLYGFGGNASPFAAANGYPAGFAPYTPSIVRIERTPNYRLVNIVDYGRMSGNHPIFGQGIDARLWHAVLDSPSTGPVFLTAPLERPALIKRGN